MLPAHLKERNDLLELTVTIYHLLQTHHAYQINTFTLRERLGLVLPRKHVKKQML